MDRKPSFHEIQASSANNNASSMSSNPSSSHGDISARHGSHNHRNLSVNTHSHSMLLRRASHMDRKPYARPAHVESDMPSPSLGNLPQAMQDVNLSHAGSIHHMGANQPSVLDPILSNPSSLNLFHTSERTTTGAFPVVLEMCRFDWSRVMERVWKEPGWSSEPPLSPNNRRETNHQPTCAGRYGAHNALYEAHEQEQTYLPSYQEYVNRRPSPCLPFHSGQYGSSPPDRMGGYKQPQLPPSLQRSSSYAGQVNNAGYWQSSQPMRRNTHHDAFGPVPQAQSYPMGPSSHTMTPSSSFAGQSDNTGPGSSNSIKLSLPMGDFPQAVSPHSRPTQAEEASSSTYHCAEPVYDPRLLTESSSYNNPGGAFITPIESSSSGCSQVTHGSADADHEDDGTDSDRQLSVMSCSYNGSSSCWNLPYQTSYFDSSSGGGSSSDLSNNIAYPLANAEASSSRTREATVTVRNFGYWQEIDSNAATGSGSGSGSASALSTTESAPALLAPDWLAAIQNISDPSSDSDESPLSTNVIEEAIQLGLMNPANPAQTVMMVEDALLLDQSVFGATIEPIPSPLPDLAEIDTEVPAATQDDQVSQVVVPQPAGLVTPSRVVRPAGANSLELFTPNTRQLIDFLESGEGFGAISELGGADDIQNSAVIQGAEIQQN